MSIVVNKTRLPVTQWQTESGSVVSISDARKRNAKSLAVSLEPIQDLHGYANPWVGGAGKNLCRLTEHPANPYPYWGSNNTTYVSILNSLAVGTYTISLVAQVVTLPSSGSVTYGRPYITALINGVQTPVLGYSVTIDNSPYVGKKYTVSGTFNITAENMGNINNCYFYCDSATTHSGTGRGTYNIINVQIEKGSTATAFEPYENICPISGRSSVTAVRDGKNLLKLVSSEMIISGWNRLFPFSLKAGTYIISCQNQFGSPSALGCRVALYNENKQRISALFGAYTFGDSVFSGSAVTITEEVANQTKYICFELRASGVTFEQISVGGIMVELGSTASSFEPYNGTSITVQLGQTVYGGTVDLCSGVGTLTMANIASYNGETIGEPWLSSMDKYVAGATPTTGAQVVYTLATPITFQLSPNQIQMLERNNTIWADEGDIAVTYARIRQ